MTGRQREMLDRKLTANKVGLGPERPIRLIDTEHLGRVEYHSHDFCELVYVKEGYTVHYYGGYATVLTEGDLFAVSPGVMHAYTGLHYTKVYNCVFLPEFLGDSIKPLSELTGVSGLFGTTDDVGWIRMHLDTRDRMKVISIMDKIAAEENEALPGHIEMQRGLLVQLLVLLSRIYISQQGEETTEHSHMNYVIKALSYIEDNYRENIDLSTMAERVGISPDYLSRQFKKAVGVSPVVFLRGCRFARAMELIRTEPEKSMEEISSEIGYKYLSHFSREFRVFTGMTPSEFKKTVI